MRTEPLLLCSQDSFAWASHRGSRVVLDDRVLACPRIGLYAIADGLGGSAKGSEAAELALDSLAHAYERVSAESFELPPEVVATRLVEAVCYANDRVFRARTGDRVAMGTTLVALVRTRHAVVIAHVGDSRAYRLERGCIRSLTRDHSLASLLADRDPDSTYGLRFGHLVLRSVGRASRPFEVDVYTESAVAGARYLLASDGVTEVVSADALASELSRGTPDDASRAIIRAARRLGTIDNASALVLDLRDRAKARVTEPALQPSPGLRPGPRPAGCSAAR